MNDQPQTTPVNPAYMPNGALNFFVSLVPGAGQMYQGLLQRGVMLMALFAGFIALTSFFSSLPIYSGIRSLLIGVAVTGIVVTYFYSFFDSMRTCRLIRAGIQMQDYLGVLDHPFTMQMPKVAGRGRTVLGVLLVVAGALSLLSLLINRYLSRDFVEQYLRPVLEVTIPLIFLVLGAALLFKGRKANNKQA